MGLETQFLYGTMLDEEFEADLGDPRRTQRLQCIGEQIAQDPQASFVEIFDDSADREGFYRFVRNEHVDFQALLSAHVERTVQRAHGHGQVLVLHDTTEFRFPLHDAPRRDHLHRFSKTDQGFRAHVSLVSSADGLRAPLGVLGLRGFVPPSADEEVRTYWSEQFGELVNLNDRWFDAVEAAERRISGRAQPIHVADREADFFSLLALMDEHGYDYVVRAKHNRGAKAGDTEFVETLDAALAGAEFVAERTVDLSARSAGARPPDSRRKHPPRARRPAHLHFRFIEVELQPPPKPQTSTAANQPLSYRPMRSRAIEVVERDPAQGVDPVRWVLLTSQPVEDVEQMLRVVDQYRSRWLIEEFFKALKTGCAYLKRQMGSASTLLTTLAILSPIAWRLLLLRHLARQTPDAPAALVVSKLELEVLRARTKKKHPLPRHPSAAEVCAAIGRLGGHIKQNGPPGWLVLGRGFQKLLTLTEGYKLMLESADL